MFVTLLAVVSCNDHDYDLDKLVPDAYHKISYIKEYGTHNLHLFTTQTEYTDSLILIKAGSDPSTSVNLKMDVLDQVAVDSVYNQLLGTNYKVLPANCYSFANGQDVSFASGQEGQYFPVTFNPTAIYKLAQQDADAQYVLSLQLNTVGKDSVNSDMNRALYVVDVKSPVLGFGATEIQATMIYKSLDVKIPLVINNTDRNTDDITLALDNAGQAKAVADYNNLHGTSYKLLPSSSYSFSNLGIGKGFIRDTATLVVNRANLENDETYILPLKIGSSSMGEKMQNDSVYSYAIVSVPLYATAVVPVSQCKVTTPVSELSSTRTPTPSGTPDGSCHSSPVPTTTTMATTTTMPSSAGATPTRPSSSSTCRRSATSLVYRNSSAARTTATPRMPRFTSQPTMSSSSRL